MADKKCKIVIFSLVLLVAVILLGVLIAHKSGSSKLCENPNELYFGTEGVNGTCYPAGNSSACQGNLILVPSVENKYVGICNCDSESNPRATVYHAETNSCYYIFRKAYCASGEWLTIDKVKKQPVCVVNHCGNYTSQDGSEIVPLSNKRCVELGKPDKETCTLNQVVQFFKNRIYPSCSVRKLEIGGVGNNRPPQCPSGTYNSPLGGCQPEFDFD